MSQTTQSRLFNLGDMVEKMNTDRLEGYLAGLHDLKALTAEENAFIITELKEALRWYAEQVAGCDLIHTDIFRSALIADGGQRARVALEKVGEINMTVLEEKMLELINKQVTPGFIKYTKLAQVYDGALLRGLSIAVEQHEATKQELNDFRQHVSDIVYAFIMTDGNYDDEWKKLSSLVITEPDPLVEVLGDLEWNNNSPECAAELRDALKARGLQIVELKNDD